MISDPSKPSISLLPSPVFAASLKEHAAMRLRELEKEDPRLKLMSDALGLKDQEELDVLLSHRKA
jgi:hypothetical protein